MHPLALQYQSSHGNVKLFWETADLNKACCDWGYTAIGISSEPQLKPLLWCSQRFKDIQTSIKNGDPYVIHENGTLEIHVAQLVNSGKYTCIATNNLGIKENHVFLEVKGRCGCNPVFQKVTWPRCPVLTAWAFLSTSEPTRILKQPEYKVVQRGMSAAFECKVKHDPTLIPTMTWLKDSGELPDDERYQATQAGIIRKMRTKLLILRCF